MFLVVVVVFFLVFSAAAVHVGSTVAQQWLIKTS